MADVALPEIITHVFNMGMRAFRDGKPRTDHPFNSNSNTIATWQHGYDAAAAASNNALAARRRVDVQQGFA